MYRLLNEIFGPGNWSSELSEPQCSVIEGTQVLRISVIGKITVGDVTRAGLGASQVDLGKELSMIEMRLKDAATDALKRTAIQFGDAFGLHLYDKAKKGRPTQRIVDGGNTQGQPAPVAPASGKVFKCEEAECGEVIKGYKSGPESKYKGQIVTVDQFVADSKRNHGKALCRTHYMAAFPKTS